MTKARGLAHGPEPGTQKLETETPASLWRSLAEGMAAIRLLATPHYYYSCYSYMYTGDLNAK